MGSMHKPRPDKTSKHLHQVCEVSNHVIVLIVKIINPSLEIEDNYSCTVY